MQEIEVKENPLKVKVFINGTPELKNIPKEKAERLKKMQHKTTYFPNFA